MLFAIKSNSVSDTEFILHTLYLCSKAVPTFILKAQNLDVFEFGKDLWRSAGSSEIQLLLRQGHLDPAAQDRVQMPFDYLLSTTTSMVNLYVKQFKTTKPQTDKTLTHCACCKSKVYFCMCENKLMNNVMESSSSDFNIPFSPQCAAEASVQSNSIPAYSHICSKAEVLITSAVKGCKCVILERKVYNTSYIIS